MKLGSRDWAERDIDYEYGMIKVTDEWIIIHLSWPYMPELLEARPDWFLPAWENNQNVKFLRLDHYRALKQYAGRPEWAGLKPHEFVERTIAETP